MRDCRCETLPADFTVGIDHARLCPQSHPYTPVGGVSLVAKPCRVCALGPKAHALTAGGGGDE